MHKLNFVIQMCQDIVPHDVRARYSPVLHGLFIFWCLHIFPAVWGYKYIQFPIVSLCPFKYMPWDKLCTILMAKLEGGNKNLWQQGQNILHSKIQTIIFCNILIHTCLLHYSLHSTHIKQEIRNSVFGNLKLRPEFHEFCRLSAIVGCLSSCNCL